MALIIPGSGVGQISGRVGSVVYSHNRGGQYVRAGSIPVNTMTEYRQSVKNTLSACSKAWVALTDTQREAWNSWAGTVSWKNRLGQSITLSGQNAFVQCNSRILLAGGTLIDIPSINTAPEMVTGITLTTDIGAGTFGLAWTSGAIGATKKLYCRGCVVSTDSVNNVTNRLRGFYLSALAATSPQDLQSAVESRFGTLQAGQYFHIEASIIDTKSGLQSSMYNSNAEVVDTV